MQAIHCFSGKRKAPTYAEFEVVHTAEHSDRARWVAVL
jgi:hypothetical protein